MTKPAEKNRGGGNQEFIGKRRIGEKPVFLTHKPKEARTFISLSVALASD